MIEERNGVKDTMLLKLKVKPSSSKQKVVMEKDDNGPYLKVWLKSPPEKGKANKELLGLLKRIFGEFEFVSGATSREKLIKIDKDIDIVKNIKERT